MNRRLLVTDLAMLAALFVLAGCTGAAASETANVNAQVAPVEMEVASAPKAELTAAEIELLSPEFGCGGPGYLEYGAGAKTSK